MGSRRQLVFDVALWVFALFLAWVFIRQGIRDARKGDGLAYALTST